MATVYKLDPQIPENEVFTAAQFRSHIAIFPEGQFIAVDTTTDTVVGLTVSMHVRFNPHEPMLASWWELIGKGWLTTHAPHGEWLYGVEYGASCLSRQGHRQAVDQRPPRNHAPPQFARLSGGQDAIISYHTVADTVPVKDYVADVIAGRRFDNNLSKQIKMGFKPMHIIPNYLPDADCAGYGVEMMIENAAYIPPRLPHQPNLPLIIQPTLG